MMEAEPELRDVDAALSAIKRSRTPFEQYHALLLADRMLDDLSADDKQRLVEIVSGVQGWRFRHDTDRRPSVNKSCTRPARPLRDR